jgi:hypothetical protein
MTPFDRTIRVAVPALALLAIAGCATPGTSDVAPSSQARAAVEAPQYRVGDRWVYRVRDGWRNPVVYEETQTVTSIAPDGVTVRVTMKGERVNGERIEKWSAPGLVVQGALFDIETRRFATPLERYRFPLQPGATWNQFVDNYNEFTDREGRINRYVRVAGFDRVTTPAGTFDAVRLLVIMRLDDEEFWRWPTDCTYTVWYAPAAKASVREVKRADYLERASGPDAKARLPSQNALVELVSFTPGA